MRLLQGGRASLPALANEVGKPGTLAATPVTSYWHSHRLEGKMPTLLDPPLHGAGLQPSIWRLDSFPGPLGQAGMGTCRWP